MVYNFTLRYFSLGPSTSLGGHWWSLSTSEVPLKAWLINNIRRHIILYNEFSTTFVYYYVFWICWPGIHFIIFKHLYKVPESTSLTNTYIYLEYVTLNITCNQTQIPTTEVSSLTHILTDHACFFWWFRHFMHYYKITILPRPCSDVLVLFLLKIGFRPAL
jgi:hypothetical protein